MRGNHTIQIEPTNLPFSRTCPLATEIERILGTDELITKDKTYLVIETDGHQGQLSPRQGGRKTIIHTAKGNGMVINIS